MPQLEFLNEGIDFSLSNQLEVESWLINVAETEQVTLDSLSIIFCSDDYLLKINQEYLDHDYFTDIITFDNSIDNSEIIGDVFISIDRVKENAAEYHEPFEKELSRVIIHGLLHLCGYNDKNEEEQKLMRQKENTYISLLLN